MCSFQRIGFVHCPQVDICNGPRNLNNRSLVHNLRTMPLAIMWRRPEQFFGGYKAVVRPDPIPNSAVKRSVADGSACIACARVGSRQIFLCLPAVVSDITNSSNSKRDNLIANLRTEARKPYLRIFAVRKLDNQTSLKP